MSDYLGWVKPRLYQIWAISGGALNNTFQLLLNAYPDLVNQSCVASYQAPLFKNVKTHFPILIALLTLEYLNALEDSKIRKVLLANLLNGVESGIKMAHSGDEKNYKINPFFIQFFGKLQEQFKYSLFDFVEPFVLPAIECDLVGVD
jgi:hypothetical protein